jgi:hypothetical protein
LKHCVEGVFQKRNRTAVAGPQEGPTGRCPTEQPGARPRPVAGTAPTPPPSPGSEWARGNFIVRMQHPSWVACVAWVCWVTFRCGRSLKKLPSGGVRDFPGSLSRLWRQTAVPRASLAPKSLSGFLPLTVQWLCDATTTRPLQSLCHAFELPKVYFVIVTRAL